MFAGWVRSVCWVACLLDRSGWFIDCVSVACVLFVGCLVVWLCVSFWFATWLFVRLLDCFACLTHCVVDGCSRLLVSWVVVRGFDRVSACLHVGLGAWLFVRGCVCVFVVVCVSVVCVYLSFCDWLDNCVRVCSFACVIAWCPCVCWWLCLWCVLSVGWLVV